MSNVSPRPWKFVIGKGEVYNSIESENEVIDTADIVDGKGNIVACNDIERKQDFKHIVKAVNEYDGLVADAERQEKAIENIKAAMFDMQQQNKCLSGQVERLKQENEQLREALKKCDPIPRGGWTANCIFCGEPDYIHKPDCEYVRLCGGGKDV